MRCLSQYHILSFISNQHFLSQSIQSSVSLCNEMRTAICSFNDQWWEWRPSVAKKHSHYHLDCLICSPRISQGLRNHPVPRKWKSCPHVWNPSTAVLFFPPRLFHAPHTHIFNIATHSVLSSHQSRTVFVSSLHTQATTSWRSIRSSPTSSLYKSRADSLLITYSKTKWAEFA